MPSCRRAVVQRGSAVVGRVRAICSAIATTKASETRRRTPTRQRQVLYSAAGCRVPELPEVELVRRELEPVMRDARIEHVVLRRPDLRTRFPRRFAARLEGRTVLAVERRAKYLLVPVSSGETLIMHLGMSGSFRIETGTDGGDRVERDRHDHVIFDLSSGAAVIFNDPRRFGFMDLARPGSADGSPHDQHARTRAAVSGVRRTGARPRVRGKEDVAQGSAPGSTRRRWSRQHLCQRSAARGRAGARAAGENDRDTSGYAARRRVSADSGDQAGAGARDRARLRRQLPWRAVSRLRPRGRTMSPARLRRHRLPPHAGRPIDVLLPQLPALTVRA